MRVIADTNKLFSAALSANGTIAQTLFSDEYAFIIPHFTMIELFKYKDKLIGLTKKTEVEVLEILYHILLQVDFYNEKSLSLDARQCAYDLCKFLRRSRGRGVEPTLACGCSCCRHRRDRTKRRLRCRCKRVERKRLQPPDVGRRSRIWAVLGAPTGH